MSRQVKHAFGSVQVADHGAVLITRSLPAVGLFATIMLTKEEVDAIRTLDTEEAETG